MLCIDGLNMVARIYVCVWYRSKPGKKTMQAKEAVNSISGPSPVLSPSSLSAKTSSQRHRTLYRYGIRATPFVRISRGSCLTTQRGLSVLVPVPRIGEWPRAEVRVRKKSS